MMNKSLDLSETQDFSNQVAGHDGLLVVFDHPDVGNYTNGEKSDSDSETYDGSQTDRPQRRLLKPVVDDARGASEYKFYERVFDSERADTRLQKFVPEFFGCVNVRGKGKYMKLADLTAGFEHPCVADVKMGRQTFDPDATPAKKAREMEKYPQMSEVGFKFCGMRTYNPKSRTSKTFDRSFGLSVTKKSAPEMLATFLNLKSDDSQPGSSPPQKVSSDSSRGRILDAFLQRLREIRAYMETQTEFHFFCTSLLFVYDGKYLEESSTSESPRVGVYMIDFGHIFPATEVDAGYAYGARRLCDTLQMTRDAYIE